MRILTILLLLVGVVLYWSSVQLSRPLFDESLEQPPARSYTIAPLDEAVTLARHVDGRVLLVTAATAAGISGIDLHTESLDARPEARFGDAREAYNRLGSELLQNLARTSHLMVRVPWSDLTAPVDSGGQQIAGGTNYRAHAEEVGHEGDPFLFPKLSGSTAWNAPVVGGGRLDYEIELCAVPMTDYVTGGPVQLGYLLCNDFTDRWQLVRHIDLDGPMGVTGFPEGKGGDSRLPIGPLLVVPRQSDFYATLELHLYVDGALRQRATAGSMIWTPLELLERALSGCETGYVLHGEPIRLVDCERIPGGTLVLTGTPEGVMFTVATIWAPWAYLRPGQLVQGFGTHLGALSNEVVAP